MIDNYLCTGRKGCLRYTVEVDGVETHSGNDFQGGRSAIAEMAYKIIDFHNMTDLSIGNTCNIGTISGGTVPNAVPAHCEVVLDMRYTTLSGKEKLLARLDEICKKTYIDGTSTKYAFLNKLDVFETTDEGMRFFEYVRGIAKEYGLPEVNGRPLGRRVRRRVHDDGGRPDDLLLRRARAVEPHHEGVRGGRLDLRQKQDVRRRRGQFGSIRTGMISRRERTA